MTSTATPAGRSLAADDGWAIFAMPPGERDLAIEEYWEVSLERSRRRREAPRRPRLVQRSATRASLALAALAVAGAAAGTSALGTQAASAQQGPGATGSLDLARGSTGPAVRSLQSALGITADGIFGPQTERAVKAFQGQHGIPATGFVGPLTTQALGGAVSAPSTASARSAPSSPDSSSAVDASDPGSEPSGSSDASAAVSAAMSKVGAPYGAGSAGPSSFDCSGLTTWAFRQAGVSLARTSFAQFGVGSAVSRGNVGAGDLVFFDTAGPGASDVGIATSATEAVSATTHGVMVHPIFTGYWGSHFVGARRV